MRRVVVTGMGIVSSIGNDCHEVTESLKQGRSGITFSDTYAEMGFRSHVHGSIKIDIDEHVDRKLRRFMGDGAAYNYIAMKQAIEDAGLGVEEVSNERTGLVMGSGGPSTSNQVQAADLAREKSPKRVGPYMVPRCMSSTNSANLATAYKIKGHSYSISSACSTSAHCVGNGAELIQTGKQDIVFAGGGEELDWTLSVLFDGMGAMSSRFNDMPARASRAYDVDRDGFIDLLVGAHERDGDQTSIYWGSSTGSYGASARTVIPAVASFGAILDIEAEDLDSDGDRDLVINRTRDGDDGPGMGFYNGRWTQLVLHDGSRGFSDGTGRIDDAGNDTDMWFPWMRIEDVDGDGSPDIVPDDRSTGYVYLNDGAGSFTKTSLPLPH